MTAADLFAAEDVSQEIERLFIGFMLPASAARSAGEVLGNARAKGLRGSAIRPDRLHVTLIHVGDYLGSIPDSTTAHVLAGLSEVFANSFEAVFDQLGSFAGAPGKHPLVLQSSEPAPIDALRAAIATAVMKAGVRTLSRSSFVPHVTLSYADRQLPLSPIAPIRWRVDEVLLIHSEVGRSTYHTLGRLSLNGETIPA